MRSTICVLLWFGAIAAIEGNHTHLLETSLEDRLLSRKVRGLVFPDKASVLLTAALTKLILGGRPSGLQYSLEFDMYVPVPDTIEGWQPKILKRPKPTPKRRYDWSYYKRPASYYPYYSGPYPNSFYKRPAMNRGSFYQTNNSPAISRNTFYQTSFNRKNLFQPNKDIYKTSSALNRDSFYQSPWSLSSTGNRRNFYQPEEEVYESWSQVPSWKLNRGYRERREIFDQFEAMGKVFQIDLRSCIKRAMCELRAKLNSGHDQGFLMEDLMRIVLTVPDEVADDKYRHRMDVQDCARFYSPSCPYKVLDFLTQSATKM
ncbi:uncharacterized protein LOC108092215 isoform X2 [Drosophila ficusphila]|uniref:uncharacterized protein LOC108092215 isoform X2 n=1 Tax=Drosophila ficusphila TaxID=30025 RepID=UPI0007E89EB4|nr:uncharacterized protein LOC108092215 isoform X2 [Drosophila ficusphila]